MDRKEAKKLYKSLKKDASFDGFDLVFNDKKKLLFLKEKHWQDCRLYHYSDIIWDQWFTKETTVDKGHPYLGAVAGNMATGTFGGGFAGALAGQAMPGKKVPYIVDPYLKITFKDKYECERHIWRGRLKANGFLGWLFEQEREALNEQLDRAQGKPTPEEAAEEAWRY